MACGRARCAARTTLQLCACAPPPPRISSVRVNGTETEADGQTAHCRMTAQRDVTPHTQHSSVHLAGSGSSEQVRRRRELWTGADRTTQNAMTNQLLQPRSRFSLIRQASVRLWPLYQRNEQHNSRTKDFLYAPDLFTLERPGCKKIFIRVVGLGITKY